MSDLFTELRAAILRGEYAPRQRLIETELTERYATTRFVLRNALTRLATEGLVELQPNRGARVREISVEEAIEITEIRRAVEGLVAARAAERITDQEIAEVRVSPSRRNPPREPRRHPITTRAYPSIDDRTVGPVASVTCEPNVHSRHWNSISDVVCHEWRPSGCFAMSIGNH